MSLGVEDVMEWLTAGISVAEKWREMWRWQVEHVPVYREWLRLIRWQGEPSEPGQVPFLPVGAFRFNKVVANGFEVQVVFRSSGTTDTPAYHPVVSLELYRCSCVEGFRRVMGYCPAEAIHLCLVPSMEERPASSLIHMLSFFVSLGGGAFYGHRWEVLLEELPCWLRRARQWGRRVLLWGMPYVLLEMVERGARVPGEVTVIETGGMKGMREELPRWVLHSVLREGLGVREVISEYGMCELSSQAYTRVELSYRFFCPPWFKVLTRDIYVPGRLNPPGRTGLLCFVDLANAFSCAFIESEDIGVVYEDGSFEVLGRAEWAEVRGCNLLWEELGLAG